VQAGRAMTSECAGGGVTGHSHRIGVWPKHRRGGRQAAVDARETLGHPRSWPEQDRLDSMPVVAIAPGVLVLDESIAAMVVVGVALVLVGVALTHRHRHGDVHQTPATASCES
jgi:hypothetical protein